MAAQYYLDKKLRFPCSISQLSTGIKNPPFSDNHIERTVYNDKKIIVPVSYVNTGFLYHTVNSFTRLNLHQPAKLVFEKTNLKTSYLDYIDDMFHLTRIRNPVMSMDEEKYMALFRRLILKDLYSIRKSKLHVVNDALVKDVEEMVLRATRFFQSVGFIESNMDVSKTYTKHVKGGICDYLCAEGIYALRTSRTGEGHKKSLTHLLIQTLLCKMDDKYHDFQFKKIGVYNACLNTLIEYSLSDVDESFVQFIYDIHSKGKLINE